MDETFLKLNNLPIPIDATGNTRFTPVEMGEIRRAFSGKMLDQRRRTKLEGTFETTLLTPEEARILKGILLGEGDSWSFDTDLVSSKGILPNTGHIATLRPGEGKFGGAVAVEEGTENAIGNGHFGGGRDIENESGSFNPQYFEIIENPHKEGLGVQFDYVLRFNPTNGEGCEYEVHPKNGYTLTPGIYTLSLYAYVSPDWDGTRQLLHSRWRYDGGQARTTTDGFPSQRGRWERISTTIDMSDVTSIEGMDFYIGYPQRSTQGYVLVTSVQVEKKPFPTSFVNGTRAAGKLEYPVIPSGNFTVHLNVSPNIPWGDLTTSNGSREPLIDNIASWGTPGTAGFLLRRKRDLGSILQLELYTPTVSIDFEYPYTVREWATIDILISGSTASLYIDGQLIGSEVFTRPTSNILKLYRGTTYGYFGRIDELLILPYAATEAEIQAIYNSTHPLSTHPYISVTGLALPPSRRPGPVLFRGQIDEEEIIPWGKDGKFYPNGRKIRFTLREV